LERSYGDSAYYVHLKRDPEATAKSFARRYYQRGGIIKAYWRQIIVGTTNTTVSPFDVGRHYCDTVNSNIRLFLKDKTKTMEFHLESAEEDFQKFWKQIGAEGDLPKSLQEWRRKYNASDPKKYLGKPSEVMFRTAHKVARIVQKFPDFVRFA
jgi:hypothetical protein